MCLDYPSSKIEILCVDGFSTDASRKILASYPVYLIDNPQREVVSGRNRGVEAAKGDLIAFSDADCIFDSSWLRHADSYFDDPEIAGVTGPIELPLDQNTIGKGINLLFQIATSIAGGGHSAKVPVIRPANHLPTCNAIFRASHLKKIMPIPEHLIAGEDIAMSHKLKLLGYKLLSIPDIKVQHYRRSTLRGFTRQMYRYAIARRQVSRIWTELQYPMHFLTPCIVFLALLLLGVSFFVNTTIGSIIIISFWLLTGIIGVIYTMKLGSVFWQPLIVITFLMSWTLGYIREILWQKQ